ncbi:hypothetical protein FHX81_0044 [Saccharothrix saharensis]|uniref:Uncharacterized protein n=1 Tax=Saccharothrix saharensis TaxID=571190 RepID=A0A543J4Q7_9PSEU|nr:hypothetical protein [Saccharothrix saharensis]TQM77807.1 hypothetical protein FHX81_0044 [Saccharothrix saharensis]
MRMPFRVHSSVRAEVERRWARVRASMLLGFLGPPAVSLVVALVARWSGVAVLGWVLLAVGVTVPVWFLVARVYVRRPGWWAGLIAYAGAAQALGVGILTRHALLGLPTVLAAAVAAVLVTRARAVLVDVAGGAVAGTTLGVRSASRQVRNPTGHPVLAHANFDGEVLRWHVATGPSTPDVSGGELPLRAITDVRVADTPAAPGGEVVVVRTADAEVELVVGRPHDFAALLDRRLRLLRDDDWS